MQLSDVLPNQLSKVVELLISNGVDLNAKNVSSEDALCLSYKNGHIKINYVDIL